MTQAFVTAQTFCLFEILIPSYGIESLSSVLSIHLVAPLSISHNSGLVITNSLCFNLSENTFISPPLYSPLPSTFQSLMRNLYIILLRLPCMG